MAAAELVSLYLDGLNHPSGKLSTKDPLATLAGSPGPSHDTEGRLWHGGLVVAPLHEGWKQVWLSLYSNDADDIQQ